MRILLLEDDRETAAALEKGLAREGHSVSMACDVDSALRLVEESSYDAAVLDVVVPGGSGYMVLDRLRDQPLPPHVLMLTARGSVEDRVEGLDRGADDYLVKPFSFVELAARLRALERRTSPSQVTKLRCRALEIDLMQRVAKVGAQRIALTPTEFALLAALLQAHGTPVPRRQLLREVWGYDFDPGTNVVDVHVNRVRRKLEEAGLGDMVQTVRGRGYAAG